MVEIFKLCSLLVSVIYWNGFLSEVRNQFLQRIQWTFT